MEELILVVEIMALLATLGAPSWILAIALWAYIFMTEK